MEIRKIKLGDLKMPTYNPRVKLKPGHVTYEKLKCSIENFGYIEPLIYNQRTGNVVGGNQRLQVLLDLGVTDAECVVVDLSDIKEKSLNIALNKITGEWEINKLQDVLRELQVNESDLLLTGFDSSELDNILHSTAIFEEQSEESIPKVNPNPITKEGDIWKLGKHFLFCGDSTNEKEVRNFLNDSNIDMIFTDPPYDMSFAGGGCFEKSMNKIKQRIKTLVNFNPNQIGFFNKLNAKSFYIFTSKDGIPIYFEIFKNYNFNILVWCKSNVVPFTHGTFLPDLEYLLFFSRKDKIWNNSLFPTSIYRKYYCTDKSQGKNDGNGDLHPTMKPIEIISDKICISSKVDGIVFDPFAGSGTTLIAAELTGRRCYAMEIDPSYCDIIVERYQNKFPEKEVTKLVDNQTTM